MSSTTARANQQAQPIRLYISPLNSSLLQSILPPSTYSSAAPTATFQTLETFPEKNYGYVEVVAEEAEKLKRKFNGAILRGMKVRVEDARPEKKRKAKDAPGATEGETEMDGGERRQKRMRREKPQDGVLTAVELPADRQVKRGWVTSTTQEKKKHHKKGKDSGGDEEVDRSQMIFRTSLPPNVASKHANSEDKKEKKKAKESKRPKKEGISAEVKEFTKTTKYPTFLKGTSVTGKVPAATSFVEGKGWVDEQGVVIEVVKTSKRHRTAADSPRTTVAAAEPPRTTAAAAEKEISAPIPSPPSVSTSSNSDIADGEDVATSPYSAVSSPSGITSESTTTLDHRSLSHASDTADPIPPNTSAETPAAKGPHIEPTQDKQIHPLEALFKRPAPVPQSPVNETVTNGTPGSRHLVRPAPIVTSFSFFNSDSQEAEPADVQDEQQYPPQTPFTQRDLEMRGQRSAAPTPDTAAVGKRLRAPWMNDHDEDEEDDGDDDEDSEKDDSGQEDDSVNDDGGVLAQQTLLQTSNGVSAGASGAEQSEFEKHFWAHRGDYNRAWKARKREARKEVRQAENRRVSRAR